MTSPVVGAPARTAPIDQRAEHADADEGGDPADAAQHDHGKLPRATADESQQGA